MRHGDPAATIPLTLFVSARNLRPGQELSSIIGCALRCAVGDSCPNQHDETFWIRRLQLWLSAPKPSTPLILVVFDGLNEHPGFNEWGGLLIESSLSRWRDHVAVVLTCRPDHWATRLHIDALGPLPASSSSRRLSTTTGTARTPTRS